MPGSNSALYDPLRRICTRYGPVLTFECVCGREQAVNPTMPCHTERFAVAIAFNKAGGVKIGRWSVKN